ncbi:MAG: GC-type dockerin domain-anchored protein [Phycisphaerales bacterium]
MKSSVRHASVSFPVVLAASAGACLGLAAAGASAQCTVYRLGMPDFDQRRSALPNDGRMYCFPTATANALAYITNHGYPGLLDGPRNWQSQPHYSDVSDVLGLLGVAMFTSPSDGTTMSNWRSGTLNVLSGQGGFLAMSYTAGGFSGLSPTQLADQMRIGGIVMPVIGWYEDSGTEFWSRDGGHMVTMWAAFGTCGDPRDMVLGFRDPSSSDSLSQQSPFATTFSQFSRSPKWFFKSGSASAFRPRELYKVDAYGSSDGFLYCMAVILPVHGLSTAAVTQDVSFYIPQATTDEPEGMRYDSSPWPVGHRLIAMAQGVLPTEGFVLSQPDRGLVSLLKVHFLDDEYETIDSIPFAVDLVVGRDGSAYVATPSSIRRYELTDDGAFGLTDSVDLPATPDSMVYNDDTDQLLVLSVADRRLILLDQDLTIRRNDQVPIGAPLMGDGSVTVNPIDGSEWLASTGSATLTKLTRDGVGRPSIDAQPTLPGVDEPTAVQFDDFGLLHVVDDGVVRAFQPGVRGGWVAADTPLDGEPSGPIFRIGRGRTNHTPELDDINRLPPVPGVGEEDCLADLDLDGALTIFDFLEFQNLFDSGSTWADFDFDGQLTIFDFLAFQNAFDAGCP